MGIFASVMGAPDCGVVNGGGPRRWDRVRQTDADLGMLGMEGIEELGVVGSTGWRLWAGIDRGAGPSAF